MFRRRPSAVLGMGGFASGPGGVAAWLTRRPLVIHEQNAAAGLTNRLLARLARVVLQAFPGSFTASIDALQRSAIRCANDIAAVATLRQSVIQTPTRPVAAARAWVAVKVLVGPQRDRCPPHSAKLDAETCVLIVKHQCGERTLDASRRRRTQAHDVEV